MADRVPLRGSHARTTHASQGSAPAKGLMTLTLLLRRKTPLPPVTGAARRAHLDRATFANVHGLRDDDLATVRAYAAKHGFPSLCRVLFNSNEFLFVD